MSAMTCRNIPVETAILDPEAWETPDRLTGDELYFEAGGDHRAGDALSGEREDDR